MELDDTLYGDAREEDPQLQLDLQAPPTPQPPQQEPRYFRNGYGNPAHCTLAVDNTPEMIEEWGERAGKFGSTQRPLAKGNGLFNQLAQLIGMRRGDQICRVVIDERGRNKELDPWELV